MPGRASIPTLVDEAAKSHALAARVGARAIHERPKNPAAVALGKLGASKGGKARAAALSKSERSEIARKAAESRWNAVRSLEKSGKITSSPKTLSISRRLVQWMVDYTHEHYSRPMHLGDLAAVLNMNATYLSSLFSTTTGVTFHHFLEELRLAKAKGLLCDPAKRVSDVAYAVGYSGPNYFREAFKARFGVPPSAWKGRLEG